MELKHNFTNRVKSILLVEHLTRRETQAMLEDDRRKGLANRLREAIRKSGITNAKLAERCGVSPQAVTAWLRDGKVSWEHFPTIADATSRDISWLLTGISEDQYYSHGFRPITTWEGPEDLPEDEYVFIRRSYARLAAGIGEIDFTDEMGPPLPFATSWIKARGLYRSALIVVDAKGDSMEPRIHGGDILLVNTRFGDDFDDGRIYAIRYGNELRVKRLYHRYDGAWILRSDNGRYADEVVPPESFEHVEVIGQVVWLGGSAD